MTADDKTPERWAPVLGHEGYYEVSNLGRVRSMDRIVQQGKRRIRRKGVILKPATSRAGHQQVSLLRSGRRSTKDVHRLVAQGFLEAPAEGMEIRHLDGIPWHNQVGNLRWGTHVENMADQVRHGTHANGKKTHCKRGHEFTPENTYTTSVARVCRTCRRVRQDEYRKGKKDVR